MAGDADGAGSADRADCASSAGDMQAGRTPSHSALRRGAYRLRRQPHPAPKCTRGIRRDCTGFEHSALSTGTRHQESAGPKSRHPALDTHLHRIPAAQRASWAYAPITACNFSPAESLCVNARRSFGHFRLCARERLQNHPPAHESHRP